MTNKTSHHRWTYQEMDTLRRYRNASIADLIRVLPGRTVRAITNQRNKMFQDKIKNISRINTHQQYSSQAVPADFLLCPIVSPAAYPCCN